MVEALKVVALADYDPHFPPHRKTDDAVGHVRQALQADISLVWMSSAEVRRRGAKALDGFDGYWIAPGRFEDLEAGLEGVEHARKTEKPVLGTCGGCQNMVLEFARNVLGLDTAGHGAYSDAGSDLIIQKLACSLRGKRMELVISDHDNPIKDAYGAIRAEEEYYCEFGINPAYEEQLREYGLDVAARDALGEARVYVLKDHPFYVGTVFVPQLSSEFGRPHPLIMTFLKTALGAKRSNGA